MAARTKRRARGLVQQFSGEVERIVKFVTKSQRELTRRVQAQQNELVAFLKAMRSPAIARRFRFNVQRIGTELAEEIESLQLRLTSALGLASVREVQDIHSAIDRLGKKVSALSKSSAIVGT
jgi:hypothetical protein